MKTRLDEITVSELIQLLCGKFDCLGVPAKNEKVNIIVRKIVFEFREITDPSGMRSYIVDAEDYTRANNMVTFFTLCLLILEAGETDRVRELMDELNEPLGNAGEERIKAVLKSKLAKANKTLERLMAEKTEEGKEPDVRRDFDELSASLMAHFKFQIDPDVMKASVYAHLVARMNRELKSRAKALKKGNG